MWSQHLVYSIYSLVGTGTSQLQSKTQFPRPFQDPSPWAPHGPQRFSFGTFVWTRMPSDDPAMSKSKATSGVLSSSFSSWRLPPVWKIWYSPIGLFSQVGVKIENVWNHHTISLCRISFCNPPQKKKKKTRNLKINPACWKGNRKPPFPGFHFSFLGVTTHSFEIYHSTFSPWKPQD